MSDLTLSRKLEIAFKAYFESAIPSGLTIYEGREKAQAVAIPHLICYGENSTPHPDMPTETGIRVVNMRFQIRVHSESPGARDALDGWRKTVEDALNSVPDILAFMNPPALPADDERTVTDLHVYDLYSNDEPTQFEEEECDWIEDVNVGVVCQPLDSRSA